MEHAVYLDHNATTPIRPEAAAAVSAHLGCVGNPSSVHRYGRIVDEGFGAPVTRLDAP